MLAKVSRVPVEGFGLRVAGSEFRLGTQNQELETLNHVTQNHELRTGNSKLERSFCLLLAAIMSKPCLIIIFNHRFDKNIPVLEKIYSGRFSNIFFLVPFYNGDKENVIPVYESSHFFQSFLAQGYNRFAKDEFTHYIFTGDDCLLNPALNENNFLELQHGFQKKS